MRFFKKKKSSTEAAACNIGRTGLLSVDRQLLPQQKPHVMFKVFPAIGVGIDYWHGRVAVICLDLQEEKKHI